MRPLRQWAASAPAWQLAVYYFAAWAVLDTAVTQKPVAAVTGAVIFAALMTAITVRRRKRSEATGRGKWSGEREYRLDRALASGHVPDDPDERELLPAYLARQERQTRLVSWLSPAVFGTFLTLTIFLIAIAASAAMFVCAAVFVGFLIWGFFLTRRQTQRIKVLSKRLSEF